MSESARMWMEITFNIAYLIVVWGLVIVLSLTGPSFQYLIAGQSAVYNLAPDLMKYVLIFTLIIY